MRTTAVEDPRLLYLSSELSWEPVLSPIVPHAAQSRSSLHDDFDLDLTNLWSWRSKIGDQIVIVNMSSDSDHEINVRTMRSLPPAPPTR
jgi:hypothetical protein